MDSVEKTSSPLGESGTLDIPTPDEMMTPQSSTSQTPIVSHGTLNPMLDQLSAPLPVLASLAVALLLVLVFVASRRSRTSTKGSAILVTGPSDAGKTAIHSALTFGQALPSHTSLQPNVSQISLPILIAEKQGRTVRVIDIPGHPRLRDQLRTYLDQAKAVVFVVDASTIARNGTAVAEHLHQILYALTSLPASAATPPLLLLAHKYDLLSTSQSGASLAVSRVRTILERELDKRRTLQAGGVSVSKLGEAEDVGADIGGLECTGPGGTFRFKDWEGGEIEILGSYVSVKEGIDEKKVNESDGLSEFRQWLQDLPLP